MQTKKDQEHSAQYFGDDYLVNHLVKLLQGRNKLWGVGALRFSTGYQFFKTNSVVRFVELNLPQG